MLNDTIEKKIIEECKKYGYEHQETHDENNAMFFGNLNVREELNLFIVNIDQELEQVSMYLCIDMASFGEATDNNINDLEGIKENIRLWISEENLKEVEKHFLEE